MLLLLADEDFDNDIVRGVFRRLPGAALVRVQDVGLAGRPDADVLEWAAQNGRVLLTHDVNTMLTQAYERLAADLPMTGVFAARQSLPVGQVIEEIALLAEYSEQEEWDGQVRFLPLL